MTLLLGIGLLSPLRAQEACLRFEPDTVRVEGTLVERGSPEPPGFTRVARGSAAAPRNFYLQAPRPLCTEASDPGRPGTALVGITLVQLNLDSVAEARLRPRLGELIELRGLLSRGQPGRHHAPVVLWVRYPAAPVVPRRMRP